MNRILNSFFACLCLCVSNWHVLADSPTGAGSSTASPEIVDDPKAEAELITQARQITFAGRRAGEGYFSGDGNRMVFQSERDPANPFYQIYVTDLQTGDIDRVSPGTGKTTCAWIHPSENLVLFASTHDDEAAERKQQEELDLRASGKQRRYAWDYDAQFELYSKNLQTGETIQLTDAFGYDAEASYSPDGTQIVFASNRQAYQRDLTDRERQLFEVDKAFMNDIYIMNADGSDIRRLTDEPGYDGGPFFSADGRQICWRRFSEDGTTAEVFTMNTDGTNVKRLTKINAMSWAPYFHPSGDYLIFTTNRHGFGNFELYLVRADGDGDPVRVTYTDGFDGLPVFLPSGDRISWTSTRTSTKRSQIFLGQWNDQQARQLLGLTSQSDDQPTDSEDAFAGIESANSSVPGFEPTDVMRHVDYLTRPELGGRLTGTDGEKRATAYAAAYLESIGFEPAGADGTFFQEFDFPAGSSLTQDNSLTVGGESMKLDTDYRPLSFSMDGEIQASGVVFAGYGMQVPGSEANQEYDSYVHLNVADQWVMVYRDLPQDITPEVRQRMARYGSPRRKATIARDMGAKGIIFVAGPTSQVKNELIRFDTNASQAGASIAALSVTNEVAEKMFAATDEKLGDLQSQLDDGSLMMGFPLADVKVSATVGIERKRGTGRNVIARLPAGDTPDPTKPAVILGAHIDHLGSGAGSNSLAREDERDAIHVGADDNASGVGAMLEIAQYVATEKRAGRLSAKRDFIVAGWSGEELGLFGSQAFAEHFFDLYPRAPKVERDEQELAIAAAHGMTTDAEPLTSAVSIYLNLDMVGRLREKLVIQGIGSSPGLQSEVQRRNVPVGLDLELDKTSTRLPTDASAFVGRDVPILSAFTGAHEDYHTPRDTPDKLNYDGAAKIARLFGLLTRGYLVSETVPKFKLEEGEASEDNVPRARLTAYLGTIPDYVAGNVKGLKLSGVAGEGPAANAGLKGGDIIIGLAGRKIEDIYDYTYAIEALKIGEEVDVVVKRGEDELSLKITPGSRE